MTARARLDLSMKNGTEYSVWAENAARLRKLSIVLSSRMDRHDKVNVCGFVYEEGGQARRVDLNIMTDQLAGVQFVTLGDVGSTASQ